jgi:AraC family transcriptional regulator
MLVPPRTATSIYVESPHDIEMLAINYAALRKLCEGVALPDDGDFGPLHTNALRDDGAFGLIEMLSAEAAAGNPHGPLYSDGVLMTLSAVLLRLS